MGQLFPGLGPKVSGLLDGQAPQQPPPIRGWEREWERVHLAGASLGSLVLASAGADLRRRAVKWDGGMVVAILTGNSHRVVGSNQRPRAAWPPGVCPSWGDTVCACDTPDGDG
jgi:hypothetical protein